MGYQPPEVRRAFYVANRERLLAERKARYDNNVNGYRDTQLERSQRNVLSHRALLAEKKNVPCADCGVRYAPYVMDFDHVRGIKSFNIGPNNSRSREAVLAEIDKCDVVCSNCHRIRTHMRRGGN